MSVMNVVGLTLMKVNMNKIRILREGMNNVPFLSLLSMKYMVLY